MTLVITVPNDRVRMVLERHTNVWSRNHGATVTFASSSNSADIVVFPPAEMGQRVTNREIAQIPEVVVNGGPWAGLLPIYRKKLLLWGDAAYAYPIAGDATLVIYRADVLASAKASPPKSLAEFAELAARFSNERRKPSLPPIDNDEQLDREFFTASAGFGVSPVAEVKKKNAVDEPGTVANQFSFQFDATTAVPRLTSDGFVAALSWLASLQPYRSSASSLAEAFANDEAVLALGSLFDLAELKPWQTPGRYGVAPIPAGIHGAAIPYLGAGGWLAGVATTSRHADAAIELLQYLSSFTVGLEIIHDASFGAAPTRGTQLTERREGWFNYGFDAKATERLLEALTIAVDPHIINAPMRLRIPRQEEYRLALMTGLRSALREKTDPKVALTEINRTWEKIDQAKPDPERLIDYLRSVNLRP